MFQDGFNPYGDYQQNDDFETFYGADTGGIDGAFSQDDVFSMLNSVINEAAQKAREAFNEGMNEFIGNPIIKEITFYTVIFLLKLSLYFTLRSGLQKGYTNF
jgi:murein L,D-transpeptidase YafK